MSVVFLGLGSNLGDREAYIKQALHLLSQRCTIKKVSHLYLTEPVGNTNQDWFLNGAVEIETDVEPQRLLSYLKTIERKLGRLKTMKNGPRTIDLDILFYGNRIVKTKNLVIPHPSLQDRLFVLQPLMDLAPTFIHPVFNKSIQELYRSHQGKKKVQPYQ